MSDNFKSIMTIVYPEEIKTILKSPLLPDDRRSYLETSLLPIIGVTGDLSANLTRMLILTSSELDILIEELTKLASSYKEAELYMAYEHVRKRIKTLEVLK